MGFPLCGIEFHIKKSDRLRPSYTFGMSFNLPDLLKFKRLSTTQEELSREIAFRRAMENSMPTGMRVIDMSGRISYVNPSFCRIVGLTQDELLGQMPP